MKILGVCLALVLLIPISVFAQETPTGNVDSKTVELESKVDNLLLSFATYNENQTYLLIATFALVGATIFSLIWNAKNTSKTLQIANKELQMKYDEMVLKTKESQAKFKADLRVELIDSTNKPRTYDGVTKHIFLLKFKIENVGTLEVDHVEVFYKIFDQPLDLPLILPEESAIRKTLLPTTGNILPNQSKTFQVTRKDMDESKPRYVILWIEYGYDEFDNEMIYQIQVRGGDGQFDHHSNFSNDNIQIQRSIQEKP